VGQAPMVAATVAAPAPDDPSGGAGAVDWASPANWVLNAGTSPGQVSTAPAPGPSVSGVPAEGAPLDWSKSQNWVLDAGTGPVPAALASGQVAPAPTPVNELAPGIDPAASSGDLVGVLYPASPTPALGAIPAPAPPPPVPGDVPGVPGGALKESGGWQQFVTRDWAHVAR
jgi:hypothetical protein